MKPKGVAKFLSDLGITKTHWRPHVSNENQFSESQFKTLKYRPGFPNRLGCIQDARVFAADFFQWYNLAHRHSGVALYTPSDVYYGLMEQVHQHRQVTLDATFQRHPERFHRKPPKSPFPTQTVWANLPKDAENQVFH